jgi:hypothetical protein
LPLRSPGYRAPAGAAPPQTSARAAPGDAFTLVRQALAALEVSPPDIGAAAERVIKAQFARDTQGVDMPRVREAQQALDDEDATAAAAYLMKALGPAERMPGGPDPALLVPAAPPAPARPAAYGLLTVAVLLIAAGAAILRR